MKSYFCNSKTLYSYEKHQFNTKKDVYAIMHQLSHLAVFNCKI